MPHSYLTNKIVFVLFPLMTCFSTNAQNSTIDSLVEVVRSNPADSLKSLALIDLASNYFGYDTAKSDQSLSDAWRIVSNNKWDYNTGYYYNAKSDKQFNRGLYGLSLQLADSAISFYNKLANHPDPVTRRDAKFQIASLIAGKGVTTATMGRKEEAIEHYYKGLSLLNNLEHPLKLRKIGNCYNNIATLYFGMGQYDKCLEYDVKAIEYHVAAGDDESTSYAYVFAASDYSQVMKYDSSKYYFEKAMPFIKRLNKPSVNIEYYGKTGLLYATMKQWSSALSNYTANNLLNERLRIYNMISQIYAKKDDYKSVYKFLHQYMELTRSSNQAEMKKKINELEAHYQSAKREAEIIELQKDKKIQQLTIRQKSTLNYLLIGGLAAFVIIGVLLSKSYSRKQQLATQRIRELETEKKLSATEAILRGQEEERSRLAKDLHDGLGGLLSGVKFSLTNMKDNLIVTPDNMSVFERSLDMLDTSIKELRRVAHNMMPEMLVKFGLDEALKEYCNSIAATKMLLVRYQSFGMDQRIEGNSEIIIYRIIQELLNNILKHAAATEALVQIVKRNDRLSVLVEDNGRGFDTATLESARGAGWTNIRSRIDYLKGRFDIHSEKEKGTTVTIEFIV